MATETETAVYEAVAKTDAGRRCIGIFTTKSKAVLACLIFHQQAYKKALVSPSWHTTGKVLATCVADACYTVTEYALDEQINFYT